MACGLNFLLLTLFFSIRHWDTPGLTCTVQGVELPSISYLGVSDLRLGGSGPNLRVQVFK